MMSRHLLPGNNFRRWFFSRWIVAGKFSMNSSNWVWVWRPLELMNVFCETTQHFVKGLNVSWTWHDNFNFDELFNSSGIISPEAEHQPPNADHAISDLSVPNAITAPWLFLRKKRQVF
jgi:hypothetical protein